MCFWSICAVPATYPCFLCNLMSFLSKKQLVVPNKQNNLSFQLLGLPHLAVKSIIEMMDSIEVVKLSMCSYQLELFIKNIRLKRRGFHIHSCDHIFRFDINETIDIPGIQFNILDYNKEPSQITKMEDLFKRYRSEKKNNLFLNGTTSITEPIDIYRRLSPLFRTPNEEWILYFDELKYDNFMYYLSIAFSEKCDKLGIIGGSLDSETLTQLMNRLPFTSYLEITSEIPLDFKHQNALKFFEIQYKEARWITLNDLTSIRNRYIIELGKTNFDCNDINSFLRYWIDSDEDMMKKMTIKLKEGTILDENVISSQLIALFHYQSGYPRIFIKGKNEHKRKHVIGHISIRDGGIEFNSFAPGEAYSDAYELLKLLHIEKNLEEERSNTEREDVEDDIKQENIEARKESIRIELIELRKQMNELNHIFLYA